MNLVRQYGWATQRPYQASGIPTLNGGLPAAPYAFSSCKRISLLNFLPLSCSSHLQSNHSDGASATARPPGVIHWAETPFFRVEKPVSGAVVCPESGQASHRATQYLTFQLSEEVRTKLEAAKSSSSNPQLQVRLYMTPYNESISSTAYKPVPVDFPQTCEAFINGEPLVANLRGLKKQPGTATPPDITPLLKLHVGLINRVEFRYVNTMVKYTLIANLVEKTTIDTIVTNLRAQRTVSKSDVTARCKCALKLIEKLSSLTQPSEKECNGF